MNVSSLGDPEVADRQMLSSEGISRFALVSVKNAATQICDFWPTRKAVGSLPAVPGAAMSVACKLWMTPTWQLDPKIHPPRRICMSSRVASRLFMKQIRRNYCKLITKMSKEIMIFCVVSGINNVLETASELKLKAVCVWWPKCMRNEFQ